MLSLEKEREMSQDNNKLMELFNAEIDDENDSFHSFAPSERDPSDLDTLSDIDEDTLTDATPEPNSEHDLKVKSIQRAVDSPDIRGSTTKTSVLNLTQYQSPKLTPLPTPLTKCHYMVTKSGRNSQMPDAELFNMNTKQKAKDPLNISPDTAALQKYAFTEIWIEEQQNDPTHKRSLNREFSAALDNYFHEKNIDNFADLSLKEQQKGNINKQLFVSPTKSSNAPSASYQTVPETETYVSPFENMPIVPEEKLLPGQKAYTIVPAGYDLTNLVEYKNPNHWHRRRTTLNDHHP